MTTIENKEGGLSVRTKLNALLEAVETGAPTWDAALQDADVGTAAAADLTTSSTDTTAGRVTRVGDFGLGGEAIALAAADLNNVTFSGIHSTSSATLNKPGGSDNWNVLTTVFGSTAAAQLAMDVVSRKMAYRNKVASTWQPWREVYNAETVLGTVSQSAGTPTGAVIERGSNANGEFVRFADGTMICTQNVLVAGLAVTTAWGSLFTSGTQTWTFPSAFVDSPTVSLAVNAADSRVFGSPEGAITTSTPYRIVSGASVTQDTRSRLSAIGRWF